MSKLALLTSGTGATVGAGAAVIVAVGAAGYLSGAFNPEPVVAIKQPAIVEPAVQAQPAQTNEVEAPTVEETPVATPPEKGPQFDIVRVEPSGEAMIAGQAEAGETVEIRLDDNVLAEVTAASDGKFASFVTLPNSAEARVLTLDVQGGAIGQEQVIIAPQVERNIEIEDAVESEPEAEVSKPLVVEADVAEVKSDAAETENATVAETQRIVTDTAQAADVAVEPEQKPVPQEAPAVLLARDGAVRVLQTPAAPQVPNAPKPDAMTALLGAISYDDQGAVALTGRASGAFVRVYLDNAPITSSRIEANGNWRVGLPSVDTGVYTLRVDELNAAGDVVARVETPFKREASEVLQAAITPGKSVQAITVQPGATLWAIAQERYGSGRLYTRVFEANSDAIRDPDMIFPGQVFNIPD